MIELDGFDILLKLDHAFIPVSYSEDTGELDYDCDDNANTRKQKLHGAERFAIETDQDQDPSMIQIDLRECSGMKVV